MATEPTDRPSTKVPSPLLEAVVRRYDPVQVILFGSRARGDAGPDSDWDLLIVVVDDTPPEALRLRTAYEAITGTRIAADVVPVRATRFRERAGIVWTLSHAAAAEDVVIYARR